MAHLWVAERIRSGDSVIDATAGNGHDTAFLANMTGETGRVFAFDVQTDALEATRSRLRDRGLEAQTQLILDGHENLAKHVEAPIAAAMFNLGYLPGSDKSTITHPDSTLVALKAAMDLLKPGGCITLVLYVGHEGGREEADAVVDLCRSLDSETFRAVRYEPLNSRKASPFFVGIERLIG